MEVFVLFTSCLQACRDQPRTPQLLLLSQCSPSWYDRASKHESHSFTPLYWLPRNWNIATSFQQHNPSFIADIVSKPLGFSRAANLMSYLSIPCERRSTFLASAYRASLACLALSTEPSTSSIDHTFHDGKQQDHMFLDIYTQDK